MTTTRTIGGGVLAGVLFYVLSLLVWALLKFLPIIPFAIAIPAQGLGGRWQIPHLIVSLLAGVFFAVGYAVYGGRSPGGWKYGGTIFIAALLPAFIASFAVFPEARSIIAYGAVVSLVSALLGGKAVAMIVK